MLQRYERPQKFFDVKLKGGMADKQCGTHAKASDDGSLMILTGNDEIVAAYAAGEWLTLSSKFVPMITINTETREEVSLGDMPVMSDCELGDAFCEAMGRG